ncbi:MAG: glycosyltransferase, partial [Clostridia bacterium]|nr:glycosyltransferase [Clostridia bacterium]
MSENKKKNINKQEAPGVCLLNDSFPPLIDGVANAVVNYAAHLPEKGYRVSVVTPEHPDADDGRFPYPVFRYPGIDMRKWVGYVAGIPFSPTLMKNISEEKPALIHSHCPIV